MKKRSLAIFCLLAFLIFSDNTYAETPEASDDLFAQIQAIQSQMHIEISGLENIDDNTKIRFRGSPEQQLAQLLAAFNHIANRDGKGRISRVVILNKKQAKKDNRILLPTRQEGNHLIVSVSLSGDGRLWQSLDMMIDTGADLVVLPDSLITELGLNDSNLTHQTMQTANGEAQAKIGMLQELKIAGETIANVEVAFVPDKLLGSNRLLGMSVLGRYKIHIDDQNQTISLFRK